jgi:hypothetical protein
VARIITRARIVQLERHVAILEEADVEAGAVVKQRNAELAQAELRAIDAEARVRELEARVRHLEWELRHRPARAAAESAGP